MDINSAIATSRFTMLQNIRTGNIIVDTFFAVFLVFIIDQIMIKSQSTFNNEKLSEKLNNSQGIIEPNHDKNIFDLNK